MKKKVKKKSAKEVYDSIRKPMPKPTRVIHPKKKYDRRDKSWLDVDKDDV